MTLVRIVKDWDAPDLMRQTPGYKGIWDGIEFTLEPVEECDYLVVLNCPPEGTNVSVKCAPNNVWAVMQEPPNEVWKPMHRGIKQYGRIFTQDADLKGKRYIHSHPALPWHVNKDYDFLAKCGMPRKERTLSWITSNYVYWEGHRARMAFLERIRGHVDFDLYGKGFNQIDDKWEGLAPYRYSLAIENFQNPFYWSEKIADCFLSWTMPIYYGCTRINEYFPPESMVVVDINDPISTIEKIRETMLSDRWERNLDAIAYARELVLKKYHLFPFLVDKIKEKPIKRSLFSKQKEIVISGYNRIPPLTPNNCAKTITKLIKQMKHNIFRRIYDSKLLE